jgi:hypothetical protein
MNMSYDAANLTTPDIKWLGVRPSDLDRFNIPQQCRLPMTDEDIKTGRKLVRSCAELRVGPKRSNADRPFENLHPSTPRSLPRAVSTPNP